MFGILLIIVAFLVVAVAIAFTLLAALAVASDVLVDVLEELQYTFQDFLKERNHLLI
jgi:hypothetical protein